MAPTASPIREVISAPMEQSAEKIERRFVSEDTHSTSSSYMFIVVVIAEWEIIMALCLVQLIDMPTLDACLLRMRNTEHMSSEDGENSAMSSALSMSVRRQLLRSMPSEGPAAVFSCHIRWSMTHPGRSDATTQPRRTPDAMENYSDK